jgi:hypothetical protein
VPRDTDAISDFLGGFVAAEGCFSTSENGRRFTFEVGLGRKDRSMCEVLRAFLGVGHIYDSPRRRPHYDDQSNFTVQSLRELIDAVVPFMDVHLPPSYKRQQYVDWRTRLLDYWEHRARRVGRCAVDGCDKPHRAHGLCRSHLYEQHRM